MIGFVKFSFCLTREFHQDITKNILTIMNTRELNHMREEAYKTATKHGYHAEERHPSFWLGLVVSECGECIHADRADRHATVSQYRDVLQVYTSHPSTDDFLNVFEQNIKDTVEDEFADIIIRLLAFAGNYDIQLIYDSTVYSEEDINDIKEETIPSIMFVITGYITSIFHIDMFNRVFKKIYCTGEALYGEDLWEHVKLKMTYNLYNTASKKY